MPDFLVRSFGITPKVCQSILVGLELGSTLAGCLCDGLLHKKFQPAHPA